MVLLPLVMSPYFLLYKWRFTQLNLLHKSHFRENEAVFAGTSDVGETSLLEKVLYNMFEKLDMTSVANLFGEPKVKHKSINYHLYTEYI